MGPGFGLRAAHKILGGTAVLGASNRPEVPASGADSSHAGHSALVGESSVLTPTCFVGGMRSILSSGLCILRQ